MLQALGISTEAEAVYVVLAPLGNANLAEIEDQVGYDTDKLRGQLAELRDLGLAAEIGRDHWQALPLLEVIHSLHDRRQAELAAATVAAESLHSNLLAAESVNESDQITVLIGREAIVPAHFDLIESVKRELCTFDKPPYVAPRPGATIESLHESSPEWRVLERGVPSRSVYHPGFDADRLSELALFAEKGEQSRTAPVPMKLILADRQTALIPSMRSYAPGHELRASIVRHPLLVEALQWLFEAVWEASVPIITSGFSETDPRRQMLIALLMTGSTDSAIATQLGINVRSVRRWISELMDELGVTTRLQLGAALVRSDNLRNGFTPAL